MSDFDTQRVGQIAALEEKAMMLQGKLDVAQRAADKWTPVVTSEANALDQMLRVCLKFGGKMATVQVSYQAIQDSSEESISTAILEKLAQNLVLDMIRPEIEPVVRKIKSNTTAIASAGKW